MTAALNAKCSGAWRAADGTPVTVVAVAGRAATVELGAPAAGYKIGRTVTLPATWLTEEAPAPAAGVPMPQPVEPVCPLCGRPLP